MKLFFDTKKKTMPQQVKRNEEDIETLKNKGFIVNPRGEYDATKTYHKYDLVSYDGDSYIFVSETDAVGIPVTNETYWQLYTSGGLNIEIGTTETLPAGSNAVVTNTGTSTDAVLNFGIPKGDKGDKGDTGAQGEQGPKGDTGAQGPQGPAGADGMQNPMTTTGAIIYGGPDGDPMSLPIGEAGQFLGVDENTLKPAWKNANVGKYQHYIFIDSTYRACCIIENNQIETFTINTLKSYLTSKGYTTKNHSYPIKSCIYANYNANLNWLNITNVDGLYCDNLNNLQLARYDNQITIDFTNGTISVNRNDASKNVSSITDTVTEL